VRLSLKFKLNLGHLLLAIPLESQTQSDPLLVTVALLKEVFASGKSLTDCPQRTLPTHCIPERLKKYLYETKEVPWYGKTKKRRVLNVRKYEFLIYKLLKKGIDSGEVFFETAVASKVLRRTWLIGNSGNKKTRLLKA